MTHFCTFLGCKSRALYAVEGDPPSRCNRHKSTFMIDVMNRRCEVLVCQKVASFGFEGNRKSRCRAHKEPLMECLTGYRCSSAGCKSSATFNVPGKPARFCKRHSTDVMLNVSGSRRCQALGCVRQANYGEPQGKRTHCAEHRDEEIMIRKGIRYCESDTCYREATHGTVRLKPTRCWDHQEPGMTAVCRSICKLEDCTKLPWYGLPGFAATHCSQHRLAGMISQPSKRCIALNCRNLALYGVVKNIHCEEHQEEGEVDLIERNCPSCNLPQILGECGFCEYCKPDEFFRIVRTRENLVINFMQREGVKFDSLDTTINDAKCGRERPDASIDVGSHIVILEIDENQHKDRNASCEETRMFNLQQANGIHTVFIRFNPDGYRPAVGKSAVSLNRRLKTLLEIWDLWTSNVPNQPCFCHRLFYDGYDESILDVHAVTYESTLKAS